MADPNAPPREVHRWMRIPAPVNKVALAGLHSRFPQIVGSLVIGVLGVGALGVGIAWCALSSTRGTGHMQRFVGLTTAVLGPDFPVRAYGAGISEGRVPRRIVYVEVGEDFGRLSLVSIDTVVAFSDTPSEHKAAMRILDTITRATWNNPRMTPVSVRARALLAYDETGNLEASGVQTDTIVDISALGSADEIAYSDELYNHYGAPKYDPAWRS